MKNIVCKALLCGALSTGILDTVVPEENITTVEASNQVLMSNIVFDDSGIQSFEHIVSIDVNLCSDYDYSFLSQLTNVKTINFYLYNNEIDMSNVDLSTLNNAVDINVYGKVFRIEEGIGTFDEAKFGFLKTIPSINKLSIGYLCDKDEFDAKLILDSKLLSELTNVSTLSLNISEMSEYRYNDLTHLKELELNGLTGDILLGFTKDDITSLRDNGVIVTMPDEETFNKVSEKMSNIVQVLCIDENSTDKYKLDMILAYVLNENHYAYEVMGNSVLADNYYQDGSLNVSEFLDGDVEDSIICGNYAALVQVLANHSDLETYTVRSLSHAWNIVNLDGTYYDVDATGLDGECGTCYTDGPIFVTAQEAFRYGIQDYYPWRYYCFDAISRTGSRVDTFHYEVMPINENLEGRVETKMRNRSIIN